MIVYFFLALIMTMAAIYTAYSLYKIRVFLLEHKPATIDFYKERNDFIERRLGPKDRRDGGDSNI